MACLRGHAKNKAKGSFGSCSCMVFAIVAIVDGQGSFRDDTNVMLLWRQGTILEFLCMNDTYAVRVSMPPGLNISSSTDQPIQYPLGNTALVLE